MQQLPLTGNLREFDIEDVLGLLEWGKTGTLTCKRGQEEISLYFIKGAIADAEHFGVPQLALGEILGRAGYLTTQQLQETSILRMGNQRRVGVMLVELGQISSKVLEDFLRLRIVNAICHLFMWNEGNFSFQRGVPPLGAGPLMEVDVATAIAEGRQARSEWGKVGNRIRNLDCVVQVAGERTRGIDPGHLSPEAERAFNAAGGGISIRMISQCLFLNDLQTARAIDELLFAGLVKLADYQPAFAIDSLVRLGVEQQGEEELIRLLAKSQVIPASMNSNKPGDRIKSLLKVLQDCVNDLLIFQDSQFKAGKEATAINLAGEYLDQKFGDLLSGLQQDYPALDALQAVNRRVDASDLIETYNLILGDTRHTFYMEAVQGLSAMVKSVFDWVLGDEMDNLSTAADHQEAWQLFFQEIESKVAELGVADGWGKKAGIVSLFHRSSTA